MSPDQRDRSRFREEIRQNFSVIASAGAGKTRAIVERIATIAARQPEDILPRLIVVTYTISAANEFRRRTRAQILRQGSEARQVLKRLDQAFFGTIHSFCLSLIAEHQAELGLPERIVIPSTRARELKWQRFSSDPELSLRFAKDPLVRQVLRFCTWQELLDLAANISQPAPARQIQALPPMPDLSAIIECSVHPASEDKRAELIRDLQTFLANISDEETLLHLPTTDSKSAALINALRQALSPLITWLEDASYEIVNRLAAAFQQNSFSDGFVTFDDQIELCRKLLSNPNILKNIRSRHHFVILDEAQDTSRSMFDVLIEITRPEHSAGLWPGSGDPPAPGRFCMVGDSRQTIYERAATEHYHNINQTFASGHGGELLAFTTTKRCSMAVVNAVNSFFKNSEISINELRYDDLIPDIQASSGYAAKLTLKHPESSNVEEIFEAEASQLADWLQQAGKPGLGIRAWNKLAVLAPRHEWLAAFAGQLDKRQIPYIYRGQKLKWSNVPSFAWPVALLYTLLHPWDSFERFGVLREIFGIADTDLAAWSHDRRVKSAELTAAEEVLNGLAEQIKSIDELTLGRYVNEIIVSTELEDRLQAIGVSVAALEEVRQLAFRADLVSKPIHDWVEEMVGLLEDEAQVQQPSSDAIELTTSHSAKGLEWDIVIPIGLSRRVYTSQPTGFPRLSHDGVCIIWNSMSQRSARKEEMRLREEYRRLLYVTLTRARHSLLFPNLAYEEARNSFLEVAGYDLSELPEVQMPIDILDEIAEEHWQEVELPIEVVDFITAAKISHSIPNLVRPHELAKDEEVSETQLHDEPRSYNYGRWWHGWIERYPWLSSPEVQKNFLRTLNSDIPFFDRAQTEVDLFRNSVEIDDLARSVEWFQPEVSFAFPADRLTWTEGIIDLVIGTRGGELWLLDWKTNQPRGPEADGELAVRLRETYLAQLEAYRTVIERGFGKNVSRLLIYSTVLGRFV